MHKFAAFLLLAAGASLVAGCAGSDARVTRSAALTRTDIEAIVAAPDRSDADRRNDLRRKPVDLLEFTGVRPGMTVLDVSAAGGYTSELLARAVGPSGRVYGQTAPRDPNRAPPAAPEGGAAAAAGAAASASAPPRPSPFAERIGRFQGNNMVQVVAPFESPARDLRPGGVDLVTLMFNYHDMGHLGVDRARMNAAIFAALKPGGAYVIADHSGRAGTGISESGTLHRVEEALVRREVEAAGFRLAGEGMFLRNPADPRDRNVPDPPQPKDEFVLRFVKP
jgi:predicted methyltransferase